MLTFSGKFLSSSTMTNRKANTKDLVDAMIKTVRVCYQNSE